MGVLNEKPLLILGGGLMGLAIAHELAQRGKRVEVLSRSRLEAAVLWLLECWLLMLKDLKVIF